MKARPTRKKTDAPRGRRFPASAAFLAAFSAQAKRWISLREELAGGSERTELIHDLRVASRRLVEQLALAPPLPRRKRLRRKLRRVITELGGPRETGVTAQLIAKLAPAGRGGTRLTRSFEHDRKSSGRTIAATARAAEPAAALVLAAAGELESLLRRGSTRTRSGMAELAARRIAKRIEPFADSPPEPANAKELHRLRVAAKKLRYLFEQIPGPQARRVESAAKKFQTAAGDWHDAAVVGRELSEVESSAAEREDRELAAAAGVTRTRALDLRAKRWRASLERRAKLVSAIAARAAPRSR